jgi:hypothetical protein
VGMVLAMHGGGGGVERKRLRLMGRRWSGGDEEGCGLRVCTKFPLMEFAGIPFRKEVTWLVHRA